MNEYFKKIKARRSCLVFVAVALCCCAQPGAKKADPEPIALESPALEPKAPRPAPEIEEPEPKAPKPIVKQGSAAQAIDKPGLSNFFKVSDELYRGAQPEPEGFKSLVNLGIKTVVNLRLAHSDRDEMREASVSNRLGYEHINMAAWDADPEEIIAFLKIATDATKQPVFVHCKHGADRTGTAVAAYRVVVQGWSKEDAVEEMVNGPFEFHEIWKGLPKFIQEMDVQKIRKEIGR